MGTYIDWIEPTVFDKKKIKKDLKYYGAGREISFDGLESYLESTEKSMAQLKESVKKVKKKYDSISALKEKEVIDKVSQLMTDYKENCIGAIKEARNGTEADARMPKIYSTDYFEHGVFVTKYNDSYLWIFQKVDKIVINKIKRKGSPFVDKLETHYTGVKELVLKEVYFAYSFTKKGDSLKVYLYGEKNDYLKTFHSSGENGQVCLGGLSGLFQNINCYKSDFGVYTILDFTKKLVEMFETINCESPYPLSTSDYDFYKNTQPKFWLPTIINFYNNVVNLPVQNRPETQPNGTAQPQYTFEGQINDAEIDDFYEETRDGEGDGVDL